MLDLNRTGSGKKLIMEISKTQLEKRKHWDTQQKSKTQQTQKNCKGAQK